MRATSILSGALVVSFAITSATAQILDPDSLPHDLPDGPAKPGFDIDRFSNSGNGWFETFHVERTRPLQDTLAAGEFAGDTRLLVLETTAGPLALLIDQMGYHHIAQLHFDNVGLYDAVFVMQDAETRTLWNHITGEALYGPHVGRTLGPVGNLLQISVEQALAMNPATEIAISDRMYFAGGKRLGTATGLGPGAGPDAARSMPPPRERPRPQGQPRINADAELMEQFVPTLGAEDLRRPRMIDPMTFTPTALFVDAAVARVEGREIHLDDGSVFRSGVLYDREGLAQFPDRPQQLFTRWYGFALTFPGSEVFGQ